VALSSAQIPFETDMNRSGSNLEHENPLVYKGPRFRASSEAWRAKRFFEFSVTYPQHKETPSGLAPIIVPGG
jgi:hypothetical protein